VTLDELISDAREYAEFAELHWKVRILLVQLADVADRQQKIAAVAAAALGSIGVPR
jgi:hypothetical protein